jgi:hypothetical protein
LKAKAGVLVDGTPARGRWWENDGDSASTHRGKYLNDPNDRFLDFKGLSVYSCLAIPTLRVYVKEGLPHFKLKGKILVKRSEFDEWMESFRINKNQELNELVDGVIKSLSE